MDQYWIKKDKTNSFCRPEISEDIKYRKIQRLKYEDELKKVLPSECNFCFHGTTIWNTKSILESGEITARIDRDGEGDDVLNTPGKIYVSTLNNIWFTVKYHADLGNYKYPAGCIFVITPQNAEEFKSARQSNLIENVDFKKQPERLKCIITTPENMDRVKEWIKSSNLKLNPNIVVDYNESINWLLKTHEEELSK